MRTRTTVRCNRVMNTPPPLPTPLAARPLGPWWPAPALFTVVALLGGAWGYHSSPIVHGSAWLALPYAVPVALVAASWRRSSRPGAQTRSLILGGVGALMALVYAHLATVVLFTAAFFLWAFQGGG